MIMRIFVCFMLILGVICFVSGAMAGDVSAGDAIGDAMGDAITSTFISAALEYVITNNPMVASVVAVFIMLQPVLGYVATQTTNPTVGKVAILSNKVAQLLTFSSAKNQPDVLSFGAMVKNKPDEWPKLIKHKIAKEAETLQRKAVIESGADSGALMDIFKLSAKIQKQLRQ